MAARLPVVSGKEARKALEKDGWEFARQRGSHMILVKEGSMATLSVPDQKEVARGTLRSLIRAAGITPEEFLELLN